MPEPLFVDLVFFFFFLDLDVNYVTEVFFFGFFEVAMVNGCWTCRNPFLSSGFSSFSGIVIFCSVYFEIECKRLEIYVANTCTNQQVGSEFLKLEFYMELEFLKLEILICKHLFYPC